LEIEPKNVAALLGLSQVAVLMDDRPKALLLAQQAVQVAPRNAQALNTLGVYRFQAGQTKEAARLFQQALALTPQDPGMLLNMARCQAQMKRWRPAEDYARRAARAAPQDPEPGLLLGDLFLQQGQVQRAVAELEALADQHPRSPKVFQALLRAGDALRQAQAPADAVKCYEQALRMAPGSLDARLGKAQALHQEGQWEQAISLYESALQEAPDHAGAMNNLAYLYAEKGEHLDRALNLATRLVTAAPDDAAGRDTLGWVLYRQGHYAVALPHLEEAAQREPQKGIFHYHRGQTLRALKREPEAAEALRKALALGLPPPEKKAAEAALAALRPEK
jgi:tetratricopeptide (TPR) repeat protein